MPKVRRCRYELCKRLVPYPNHYCNEHKQYEAEYQAKRNKARQQYLQRYNKVKRNRDNDSKQRYQFYRSRQWASLRAAVLERDYYLCQYCLAIGHTTPNSRTVDHIRPVEAFPDDKDNIKNLATICRKCHYKKTEFEQEYYGCGQGNILTGAKPIDSINELALIMRRS